MTVEKMRRVVLLLLQCSCVVGFLYIGGGVGGRQHRFKATTIDEASLLNEDAEEVMLALEEALDAVAAREPENPESDRDAMWDAAFWNEIERNLGEYDQLPKRIHHFFCSHRVLSRQLSGRNHTELALGRRTGPRLGDDSLAFFAYPGLRMDQELKAKDLKFDIKKIAVAFQDALPEIIEALDDVTYNERRRRKLFPSEIPENNDVTNAAKKAETASDYFKTATGEFDELEDDRVWDQPGQPAETDASIQASFDALDRLEDDSLSPRSSRQDFEDDDIDDIFGDMNNDVFGRDVFREEEDEDVVDEINISQDERSNIPFGTSRIILSSYFRYDQLALETFSKHNDLLLRNLPPSPRHAYLLRLEPNQQPPLYSALQGYLATLYIKLTPENENAGIRTPSDSKDTNFKYLSTKDPILMHGTALHAPYNDDSDRQAIWLVLDYWHPDLTTQEMKALQHFFLLDEQFVLRRFPPQEVLPIILDDSPASLPLPYDNADDDSI